MAGRRCTSCHRRVFSRASRLWMSLLRFHLVIAGGLASLVETVSYPIRGAAAEKLATSSYRAPTGRQTPRNKNLLIKGENGANLAYLAKEH